MKAKKTIIISAKLIINRSIQVSQNKDIMMQRRRRLIRSGHFCALRQSNSEKKEGMVTVKRTRNVSRGGVEDNWNSSSLLNLSYVIYRPDLIHSTVTGKKPLLVIRKLHTNKKNI